MKKKQVVLLVLGYVGGSFSGEPLSPFGPNPFAPQAASNPFASHEESTTASGKSASAPVSVMPAENPFASHEEPLARSVQPAHHSQEDSKNTEYEQHAPVEPDNQTTAENVADKNPDTGEDLSVDSEVDTFEQEGSGNWLLKRVWWEKTEAVYENIKQVFNEIMSARMDYISQRNRLDRELDVSYGQIGLEEGELQDIIDYCLDFAKKEKPEQGFSDKQEEDLYNALQHKQHDLDQIKLDLKALQAVDQKIDEALDTLFKQIDVANQYEQKAWDNFKDIARELNDKIARKSYYETEGLLKDIQNVHSYITSQFSSYFSQTLQTARTHSQSISSQVQALKQAGVDLKKQASALEQAHEAERLKKELAENDKELEGAEKKKEAKKNATSQSAGMVSGFISSAKTFVLHVVDRVIDAATSLASRIKGWFSKEESVVKAREKTLKLKMEEEKKRIETAVSKEVTHAEQVLNKEEQAVQDEEIAFLNSAYKEEENLEGHARSLAAKEEENPFNEHPVSVMPQEQSEKSVSDSVKAFGLPPTEESTVHPAYSHNPSLHDEKLNHGVHPVSPFVK